MDDKADTVQEQNDGDQSQKKQKEKQDDYAYVFIASGILMLLIALVAAVIQEEPDFTGKFEDLNRRLTNKQAELPSDHFCFTVQVNGDAKMDGHRACTEEYSGLDDMMQSIGQQLGFERSRVAPASGVRLYSETGVRLYSLADINAGSVVFLVPQGLHFAWPLYEVGHEIYPECVKSPIEGKPIKMVQLSESPRIWSIENFVTPEEIENMIESNKDLVKPSEVGFAGWRDDTRTSDTAWDFSSWGAKRMQKRSFHLLGWEYDSELADAVQILRYDVTQWYKPHTDWFNAQGYDNHDPTVNNGTNRFATVFVYLSTVEEGGHTVFPLSRTHEGYDGEYLTRNGTEKTPGYISNEDARWVCNTSSTALRSQPVAGNAVLFYNQLPDGTLDKYSLHGGCPVIKGLKWSSNVWIWNRPKPDKSQAKDKQAVTNPDHIVVEFYSEVPGMVTLYWVGAELVLQGEMEEHDFKNINSFEGHKFIAKDADGVTFWSHIISKKDHNEKITISRGS